MRWLLLAFALGQLVLGLLLWLTPGFFHESIGLYGARNDHYMADVTTWYLALGAVALGGLRRESWRARCSRSPSCSMPCTRSTT
jgi:hypothetical protein